MPRIEWGDAVELARRGPPSAVLKIDSQPRRQGDSVREQINLRRWWTDDAGTLQPSKNGMVIGPPGQLPRLYALVRAALVEALDLGLVTVEQVTREGVDLPYELLVKGASK